MCKQMTDARLLLLHRILKPFKMYKRMSLRSFRCEPTKWLYKSYISYMNIKTGFGIK